MNQDKNKILCCIPSRYSSVRLPGKPLLKIGENTVIQKTYEQAKKTKVDRVIVLTDDQRIYDEVMSFGGECSIITQECLNGTDRIVAYLNQIDHSEYGLIINVQGDEPFVNPEHIDKAIDNFFEKTPECSTICFKTNNREEIESKSRGKVVTNLNNDIVYCSRNVIPSNKRQNVINDHFYNIHVGIFVFDKNYLLNHYCSENTPLQLLEDIEWMKIIEQGYRINTIFVSNAERGIDTQEDHEYLVNKYS